MNDIINNSEKFKIYYNYLIEENAKYNLTSITKEQEVYEKHFLDSLMVKSVIPSIKDLNMCDVGSGAGFPSIPLKIVYPSIKLTIIEPTLKRCNFLSNLVMKLALKDVIIINARAEDKKELFETFDVVVARAVANMQVLLELCVPLVNVGGSFIAMKGSSYKEELNNSKNALKVLDCVVDKIEEYTLSKESGVHSLIRIKKVKKTNKLYPRSYQLIKKKPL